MKELTTTVHILQIIYKHHTYIRVYPTRTQARVGAAALLKEHLTSKRMTMSMARTPNGELVDPNADVPKGSTEILALTEWFDDDKLPIELPEQAQPFLDFWERYQLGELTQVWIDINAYPLRAHELMINGRSVDEIYQHCADMPETTSSRASGH